MRPQAQTPAQEWVAGWTEFLDGFTPQLFLIVVLVGGTLVMVRKGNKKNGIQGGVLAAIKYGLGAALVYLLLTNVETVASWFGGELPVGGG